MPEPNAIGTAINGVTEFLRANPERALSRDPAAVARLEKGLAMRVTGWGDDVVYTDMPESVGGASGAPKPGWIQQAALASCNATLIAMRAGQLGIDLTTLEVEVNGRSDFRGIFGISDEVPAGPARFDVIVRLAADGASPEDLHSLVAWMRDHSPVFDTVTREVDVDVVTELL